MENNHAPPIQDKQENPGTWLLTVVLFAIFVAMMIYGFYVGNVFETFHNGSTL